MFDYTICKHNSPKEFKQTCEKIEQHFSHIKKHKLLVDVDGSTIQIYSNGDAKIKVYDDYDVGAVFVISDLDLQSIL